MRQRTARALDLVERALRLQRKKQGKRRIRYFVPSLWGGPRGTASAVKVDPFAYYLGIVRKIKRGRAIRLTGRGGEWSQKAVIYNMFVRTTAAFDHNRDGKLDLRRAALPGDRDLPEGDSDAPVHQTSRGEHGPPPADHVDRAGREQGDAGLALRHPQRVRTRRAPERAGAGTRRQDGIQGVRRGGAPAGTAGGRGVRVPDRCEGRRLGERTSRMVLLDQGRWSRCGILPTRTSGATGLRSSRAKNWTGSMRTSGREGWTP